IRQRLFVPRHSRIEDRFAEREALVFEAVAVVSRAVRQQQRGGFHARSNAKTILPPTMVAIGRRGSVIPAKGVFFPFERNEAGSTVQGRSAKTVTSPTAPARSVPPSIPRMLAGLLEASATNRSSGRSGNASAYAPSAISSPLKPTGASPSNCAFSSA